MKSNKIYLSLLMGVALLTSCSKGSNEPTDGGEGLPAERMTFSAELPNPNAGGDELRTRLDSDGHTVLWTKGTDQISVFAHRQSHLNKPFTATDVKGREATFEGEAIVDTKYYALYPYDAAATFNQFSLRFTTTLQTNQRAVLGSYADNTSLAVATLENAGEDNRRFQFKNATGMLKIHFTLAPELEGESITEIRLISKPDERGRYPKLSGRAYVTAGAGSVRPTTTIDATGQFYISLSNGGAALEPTTDDQAYYMLVPTEGTGLNFSLIFTTADGRGVVKDVNFSSPFVSNRIKTVNLYIESLEQHLLTNIPLLDAIDALLRTKFVREADRSVDYFKNIEQISAVTTIQTTNNNQLNSLRELPYFVNAQTLSLSGVPNLTGSIDITKNPNLRTISVFNTGITSATIDNIDKATSVFLSNNASLNSVNIKGAQVKSLSIANLKNLTTVDLSNLPALTTLTANNSGLTALDISHNPDLRSVVVFDNKISKIDLSKNPKIEVLNASYNQLKEINLSQNPLLNDLNLERNSISVLDLSHNTELKTFTMVSNPITQLDFSRNTKLTSINAGFNSALKSLTGLESLPQLTTLSVRNTQLEALNISRNLLLKQLNIYGSKFSELDITNNTELLKDNTSKLYVGTQTVPGGNVQRTITVRMTSAQYSVFQSSGLSKDAMNTTRVNVIQQ